MGLNVKNIKSNAGNRVEQPLLEVGGYPARVVQVIDLGLQAQLPYMGNEKPPAHMVQVTYELADEFMLDEAGEALEDKPRWLNEEFPLKSLDLDRAKSTQRYLALDPQLKEDGDFTKLIGYPCIVNVVHNAGKGKNAGRTFCNVGSLSAMREKEAKKLPELVNPPKVFILDEPDVDVFRSLPEFVQDKIKANLNYEGSKLQALLNGTPVPEAVEEDEDW